MTAGTCRHCHGTFAYVMQSGLCMACDELHFAATQQVDAAEESLDLPADAYVRWPWPSLDAMYGGMGPAQLHYVVGFSGLGKTTFISSALREWVRAGVMVDVLPLEQKAETFRAYLACQELHIPPGVMLSGDFHRDFHQYGYQSADAMRSAVKAQMRAMQAGAFGACVRIHPTEHITRDTLADAVSAAWQRGAKVLLVDHIDHLQPERNESEWTAAVEVNRAALTLAKAYGMCLVLMSQGNLEMVRRTKDHIAKYQPPTDAAVYMGLEKRKLATGMIGLFRPLRARQATEDPKAYLAAIKEARDGMAEPQTVLEPGVSGVLMMKVRHYGEREGRKVYLGWDRGQIVELPLDKRRALDAAYHRIRTASAA